MRRLVLSSIALFYILCSSAQQMNVATFNIRLKTSQDLGNLWDDRKTAVTNLIKYHEFDILVSKKGLLNN